eukprot:1162698-Karenia_brevis.AAC.1
MKIKEKHQNPESNSDSGFEAGRKKDPDSGFAAGCKERAPELIFDSGLEAGRMEFSENECKAKEKNQ